MTQLTEKTFPLSVYYLAKLTSFMQGRKASYRRFTIGTGQLRETTPTENIGPPG